MLRPLFALACCTSLLVLADGCAHYQLGTSSKPTFTTLYVEPVTTKILLPQSQATVETQLRTAFLRDGRLSLVNSPEAAEATLKLHLTDYRREVATQRRDDTGLARKFTLTLSVDCTLSDRRTGRSIFEHRIIEVRRDAYSDSGQKLPSGAVVSGQLQAEYQSLPLLAEALAEKITHTVLDVW
jgi:Lipopolysaccharide-assembly